MLREQKFCKDMKDGVDHGDYSRIQKSSFCNIGVSCGGGESSHRLSNMYERFAITWALCKVVWTSPKFGGGIEETSVNIDRPR